MDDCAASFDVRDPVDLYAPRRSVLELALRLGFSRSEGQELAIVVSELISNVLKYGVRGSVRFEAVNRPPQGAGLEITARDEGPPFHDLQLAMRDGFTDRGPVDPVQLFKRTGIAAGLGAIVRLTDSFELRPLPLGKEIRVTRYRVRPRRS